MRKITEQAINAFYANKKWKKANTSVELNYEYDEVILKLHNNIIAYKDTNGDLWIKTCGWNTPTTRDRLNGLNGVCVKSIKGQLFLNGKKWDGKLININNDNR